MMVMGAEASTVDTASLKRFLEANGYVQQSDPVRFEQLTGGVSSEILRVDLPDKMLCLKRALPKLKVTADWLAPLSRNRYEWEWLSYVHSLAPANVPRPLAHDPDQGIFAMEFLPPENYPVWKRQLIEGEVVPATAGQVGTLLGEIHSRSAADLQLAARFDSSENFFSLRLDPYLVTAASKNPHVAPQLLALVDRTASIRKALVHGDVSPKNILVGPGGPVLLDAECAWYGDPAFDLAFCLNHLLLKAIVVPGECSGLHESFLAMCRAYFEKLDWENAEELERRAASLLPGLLLARSDGKSPVEYLKSERHRDVIRKVAYAHLKEPRSSLSRVAEDWFCSIV